MNYVFVKAAVFVAIAPSWSDRARRWVERRVADRDSVPLLALFAASRIGVALLVFDVLGLKLPGDTSGYYAAYASAVLGPGRTASSAYNPGFDYLLGGLLWLFGSPFSFVLAMIAAEIGAFVLFCRARPEGDEPLSRPLAIFWLLNPLSLAFIALGGQDEALVLLAWCAVFWATLRGRGATAGASAAVGLAFTKVLAICAILPAIDARPVSRRALIVYGGVVLAFAAIWAGLGVPLLGFLEESQLVTPGNLWTFAAILSNRGALTSPVWEFLIAGVAMLCAWMYVRLFPLASEWRQVLRSTGVVGAVFLLVTPKAWTHYGVMFLPGMLFLMLTLPRRARAMLLFAFLPACAFEPSLWFYFDAGQSLRVEFTSRLLMAAVDAVVIAGNATLIWHALRLHIGQAGLDTAQHPIGRKGALHLSVVTDRVHLSSVKTLPTS